MRFEIPKVDAHVRVRWRFWTRNYGEPTGLRGRIACWLRRAASRIDGRTAVLFFMSSEPALDRETRVRIVKAGFERMEELLAQTVRQTACEAEIEKVLRPGSPDEQAD